MVTQKLKRKRRGGDEGPADHLLVAVGEQHMREKSATEDGNLANMYVRVVVLRILYFTVDNTKGEYRSTLLGLHLSYGIVHILFES